MKANAYLSFNGNCAEALKFYEQVTGGKIIAKMTHGETPMKDHVSAEMQDKIIHARMQFEDTVIMLSDAPPEYYSKPQGLTVVLNIDDPAEAEKVFAGLAEGGEVRMPIQETFWAKRFGVLLDKFGIPWMINCEKPTS